METQGSGKVINIRGLKQACKHCSLHDLCLPLGMSDEDLDLLQTIIRQRRPIQRNDHLYRPGDRLTSVFAVRSGSIKTYTLTNDGQEQITGFHLPGELLGLDAISEGVHPCAAKALETTSVCELPFDQLEELAARIPGLQHQLFRIMSRGLQTDEHFMTLLGKKSSDERLAAFLGLAVETVSRLFSRFQASDLIEVSRKLVEIKNLDGLRAIAGLQDHQAIDRLG